ncbi:MAG: DpnD/PcfM family protein [Lachnospiraceae bacterium]|nr:DpnD/PcfM family protein [Lachnospiraceae bacterium]
MRYSVEITETLQRIVEIVASSEDEAISLVERQYRNEEIVLDERDYVDTEFRLFN